MDLPILLLIAALAGRNGARRVPPHGWHVPGPSAQRPRRGGGHHRRLDRDVRGPKGAGPSNVDPSGARCRACPPGRARRSGPPARGRIRAGRHRPDAAGRRRHRGVPLASRRARIGRRIRSPLRPVVPVWAGRAAIPREGIVAVAGLVVVMLAAFAIWPRDAGGVLSATGTPASVRARPARRRPRARSHPRARPSSRPPSLPPRRRRLADAGADADSDRYAPAHGTSHAATDAAPDPQADRDPEADGNTRADTRAHPEPTPEPTPSPTPEPTPEPTPSPTPEPSVLPSSAP